MSPWIQTPVNRGLFGECFMKENIMNNYAEVLEPWVIKIMNSQIRKSKIATDEIEDVQQAIVLELLQFNYDSQKYVSACEKTVVTSLVRHHIQKFLSN